LTPLRGSCQDQARNHPACGHIVAAAQAQLAATCLPGGARAVHRACPQGRTRAAPPAVAHLSSTGGGLLDAPVLVPMANPGSTF